MRGNLEFCKVEFDDTWRDLKEITIYGFGRQARAYIPMLQKDFCVTTIIDNGIRHMNDYQEIPIVTFDEYIRTRDEKIIITASGTALQSIKQSLLEYGKKENFDFVEVDTFLVWWFWQFKGEVHLGRIGLAITEKCTLRCKYCSTYMPYYDNAIEYDWRFVQHGIDMLCSLVDSIACLNIVGGEPFLAENLYDLLEFIMKNHGDIIGKIMIITNGTIVPDDRIFYIMKKNNVEVRISDYTNMVPYQRKMEELINKLEYYGIDYQRVIFEEWLDMGCPDENISMGDTAHKVRKHMLECNGRCQLLYGSHYFYCAREWGAKGGFFYQPQNGDYFDLEVLGANSKETKERLLNFHVGNLDRGFCTYCQICRGYDCGLPIKAGEQIKRADMSKYEK